MEEINKMTTMFLELAKANIPDSTPVVSKNFDYVKYGEKNEYPKYIQSLKKASTVHNRIITEKIKSIIGSGLTYDKRLDKKTDAFLDHPNDYETLDQLSRKLVTDLVEQGGFYIEVLWNPNKTIKAIHHMPFDSIRLGKTDERGNINTFYKSDDWSKYHPDIVTLDKFTEKTSGILFVKPYRSDTPYYPEPSYVSAIPHIEMEKAVTTFHLTNITNGMEIGQIVTFVKGMPSEEEMRATVRAFESRYSGPDKTAKTMFNFVDNKDQAPIVTTPNASQLDKKFAQLQETIEKNILISHGVTSPLILGIGTSTGFSNGNEIMISYKLYDSQILEPDRKIVEDTLNMLGKYNGLQKLYFQATMPVDFTWSESVLTQIMTLDEMREKIGLEPIEEKIMAGATAQEQPVQSQIGFLKNNQE